MKCDLILALDVPDERAATATLDRLEGVVGWVKIGLQLFTRHGPGLVERVAARGHRVFLDLKLHDIPNTVAKAVESLAPLPIGMLTLHTGGGREMMSYAVKAQQTTKPDLLLLGVTVLTSMDGTELANIGVGGTPEMQVARLGSLAATAGMKGLVCSPLEVQMLRRMLPADVQLVTPGIRPAGESGGDDQKRIMTPADAARAGSSYIVVGRPILKAPDPAAAARAILAELTSA